MLFFSSKSASQDTKYPLMAFMMSDQTSGSDWGTTKDANGFGSDQDCPGPGAIFSPIKDFGSGH